MELRYLLAKKHTDSSGPSSVEQRVLNIFSWFMKVICCGHTCAVKQRATKNNTWGPMGKVYIALLDAVKQQLLKSNCSNVTVGAACLPCVCVCVVTVQ